MNKGRLHQFKESIRIEMSTSESSINSFSRIFVRNYENYIIKSIKDLSLVDGIMYFPKRSLEENVSSGLRRNLDTLTDNHKSWLSDSLIDVWEDIQFQTLTPFAGFTTKTYTKIIHSGDLIWSKHKEFEHINDFTIQITDVVEKHLKSIKIQSLNVNAVLGNSQIFTYSPILI